jgi:hypothetical protein
VREFDTLAEQAVAKEAEKGYDLLFLGLENVHSRLGDIHPEVVRITSAFDGRTESTSKIRIMVLCTSWCR